MDNIDELEDNQVFLYGQKQMTETVQGQIQLSDLLVIVVNQNSEEIALFAVVRLRLGDKEKLTISSNSVTGNVCFSHAMKYILVCNMGSAQS